MSAALTGNLDIISSSYSSIGLQQTSPVGLRQSHDLTEMEHNYAFASLPSYLRGETIKTNVAKDTTAYANIRQKISSTSLTVPYEKGLDTLRALQATNNASSIEIGSILKLQKRRTDVRISTKQTISYEAQPKGRRSPRAWLESAGGSSVKSTETSVSVKDSSGKNAENQAAIKGKVIRSRPNPKRDRLGSETSSTASRSRPTSYTSWYTDDSHWSDKIDELKERYADNSDFITSMRRPSDSISEAADLTPRPTVNSTSRKIKTKHSKKKIPKLQKEGFLPPIPIHDEEQKSGDGSWSSRTTGSSKSAANVKFSKVKNRKPEYIPKRRKVEFNLQPKRPVRLPPISSRNEQKAPKKPKSILKKYEDNLDELLPSPSPTPRFYHVGGGGDNVTARWQAHLPRLRSPVPSARRQPMSFQRHHFQVKCSKEFETVAIDIQSDKNVT